MLKRIKNFFINYQLYIKTIFLIVIFIVSSSFIAVKTGITEQISKIFYWPLEDGQVAGEYTVKSALNFSATAKRGLVALPAGSGRIYLGWRMFGDDTQTTQYNLYRKSEIDPQYSKVATITNSTNYLDENLVVGETYIYYIKPVTNGVEGEQSNEVSLEAQSVAQNYFRFRTNGFNRVIFGDLNGDGFFEYIVQEPRILNNDNTCDATMVGSVVDEDCIWDTEHLPNGQHYKLTAYNNQGSFLWTFDTGLGQNGDFVWNHSANYTTYDINQDGRDEVITFISEDGGYKLAVLNGQTGNIISKSAGFDVKWTRDSLNEYTRMYLGIALLDGSTPSVVMQAGRGRNQCGDDYDSWIIAFNSSLQKIWEVSAGDCVAGHGFNIGDFDSDNKDEILMADNMIDDNGTLKWSRNSGHVDVMIPAEIDPNNNGLEIFFGWEAGGEAKQAGAKMELVSANNGNVLWEKNNKYEIHWGGVGNLTNNNGLEVFANEMYDGDRTSYLITSDGQELTEKPDHWSDMETYSIWWDGDDRTELIDTSDEYPIMILKYNGTNKLQIVKTLNETYLNKWIEGSAVDLFGDWREEIIGQDSQGYLYVYTNTDLNTNKKNTFLQDRLYRSGMTTLNQGYFRYLNTSGVYFNWTNTANKTCANQSGSICLSTQTCSTGSFTAASDSSYCCLGTCGSNGGGGNNGGNGGDSTGGGGASGGGFEWCNSDNTLCKMGAGRTPAVAMDSTGTIHISYDCGCKGDSSPYPDYDAVGCGKVCYRSWSCAGGISPEVVIGDGHYSRITVDKNDQPHVVYQFIGNSGWDAIGYNKKNSSGSWQFGTSGTKLVTMDTRIDKPRIVIDQNNKAFVSFSDMTKVAYISFDADSGPFSFSSGNGTAIQTDQKMSNGGLAVDGDGDIHFQWSRYGTDEGLYYARRNHTSGSLEDLHRISDYASNFSDISAEITGNKVYGAGQVAWGQGLFYANGDNRLEGATSIFTNTPNEVGAAAIDGDYLMTDMVVDVTGVPYLVWTGYRNRGDDKNRMIYYCDPFDAGNEGVAENCNLCTATDACGEIRWPIAYYAKMNGNTPGTPTEVVNESTPVATGQPSMTTLSRQGSKWTNPQSAAANNQGIITAFEYALPPEPYSVYFKMIDGANICAKPKSTKDILADFNCDGKVDIQDFGILLSYWDKKEPPDNLQHYKNNGCGAKEKNLNLDNYLTPSISFTDFAILLPCWGTPNQTYQAVCFSTE